MEDMSQQEKQELEYKNPNEEEGGIRRRLRDRDLLRKRKAEAEEKETNQVESQRKRSRAEDKSGAKKRGRPRKTEPTPQLSAVQEEVEALQETPAVVVVPEPAVVIQDQITGSLPPLFGLESQPASVLAAPAAVFEFVQNSAPAPTLVFGAPVPVQDSAPAPNAVLVPAQSLDSVPAVTPAPPSAPPQVETLYTESQGKEAPGQVLIEDLGPDEEEDVSPSQGNKRANEDLSETLSINVPEQNNVYSVPTVSTQPMAQEYFPGN
ncbi:transcription factor p65 isoform X2 [Neolamprologus brichardi]|uniref:transcription factor p65 isoform X2 n=1 Tax=Neolamprologus brichardi TaxID=32507 RepID=UPI0003EBFD2D|nr:transcription factor p65 isoform X2 [Neolamprologus brichardi]